MTNYANKKISVNNFDVAILCHVKGGHVIGGMVRKGQIAEKEATPMAEGPGSKLIAQMSKLTEIITFALNNKKLVKDNSLLIIGDNNLCAKVRTIVKYAGDTELETIVEGLTASLRNRGFEVRVEYQHALADFAATIVGLLAGGIRVAAHDIYSYPVDRIVMTADTKDAEIPEELIGSKVEVKNGDFTDERLQDWSIALDRISGAFTLIDANGHYGLKLDYMSDKRKLVNACFRTMCERMPKISFEEAASFNDI